MGIIPINTPNATERDFVLSDCFDESLTEPNVEVADCSAINPPYGQQDSVWKFVERQLQFVKEGGLACSIIPISAFTDTRKANQQWKYKILSLSTVKRVIKCSASLFQPAAGVQCCIVLLQKNKRQITNDFIQEEKAIFQDYSDDGRFILKKK